MHVVRTVRLGCKNRRSDSSNRLRVGRDHSFAWGFECICSLRTERRNLLRMMSERRQCDDHLDNVNARDLWFLHDVCALPSDTLLFGGRNGSRVAEC